MVLQAGIAYPFNDTKNLLYLSTDESIAVVNEEGIVTGVGEGQSEILVVDINSIEEDAPTAIIYVTVNKSNVVQNLRDNHLTFDSVNDGDTLILLKGGAYTVEEGLEITTAVKNAVKVNSSKHTLTVNKSSDIIIRKGGETKTVTLDVVTLKKAAKTFVSRERVITLDQLFTGSELILPDIQNGQYRIEITLNQNHQLSWWFAPALQGRNTDQVPEGAPKGLATALISQTAAKRGCLFFA